MAAAMALPCRARKVKARSEDDTPQGEQDLSEAIQRLSDLLREQRELNDDTLEAERRGQGMEPRRRRGFLWQFR